MEEREALLLRFAGRVADGSAVDWDDAERSASGEEERRILRQLRLVEGLSRLHRDRPDPSQADPAEMTATIGPVDLAAREVPEPADVDEDPHPSRWGHLEMREKIGEGAFGEVYRARDGGLDRDVALKLLRRERPARSRPAPSVIEEGRLMAKVRHPNVVTIHGAERHDGRVGLWMELIRGRTLDELLREEGKLGGREATLIGIELCRALASIHGAGLLHRDVKARNVMREEGGRIVLMDFGTGMDVGSLPDEEICSISGTPFYMAPEIFLGEPVTPSSDLYSLGVLLYHLVTGSYPVQAGTMPELRDKLLRREARLLRDERSDLPAAFVCAVERALAWAPKDRYETAGQMEQALSAALGVADGAQTLGARVAERAAIPRRRGPFVPVLATVTVVAAVVLVWTALTDRVKFLTSPTAAERGFYTVEASLFRTDRDGGPRRRLSEGSRLAQGDKLTLELEASRDLNVYVVNEDERGNAYALFPLPDLELQNPLPAGRTHVLPGARSGKQFSWVVDSTGGREHMLILASPERLVEFEEELSALARSGYGRPVELSENAKVRLRGIGGLAELPSTTAVASAGRLFEMAEKLAAGSERVQGVWMREIVLENSEP